MSTQKGKRQREAIEAERMENFLEKARRLHEEAYVTTREILDTMTDSEYSVYAGYYQGLAWQQGSVQGPLWAPKVSELMLRLTDEEDPDHKGKRAVRSESFDYLRFFAVVSDLDDEGYIHRWAIGGYGGWILHCTEDSAPDAMDRIPDHAHHASWWVAELAEQRRYGL